MSENGNNGLPHGFGKHVYIEQIKKAENSKDQTVEPELK